MKAVTLQIAAVMLCTAAAFISYKLLAKHVTGTSGSAWFEAGCSPDDEGGDANCDAVLASPYGYWPPKRPGEAEGTPHIPVAFLGLSYFSTLGVWLAGVGRPGRSRRWLHIVPLLWVACGLAFSIRSTYIMYAMMEEWCPWCLLTHILNGLIALCVVMLWPWTSQTEAVSAASSPAEKETDTPASHALDVTVQTAACQRSPHPSWTRVLGTLGIIIIVNYGNYGQAGLLSARKADNTLRRCLNAVARIKADTAKLVANWRLAERRDITVRPDDPVRTNAPPGRKTFDVIVFSDFQCPSCRRFAAFLAEQVEPLFAGRLKVIFKHYPLDRQCNSHVSRTLHPGACVAARIAEGARLQGGNAAFWKVHDLLFAEQAEYQGQHDRSYEVNAIADRLGLDAQRLREAMYGSPVTMRIEEDVALAGKCEVRSTPAVFVDRKRVDTLAILEIGFWEAAAELFRNELGIPGPASTRSTGGTATPGSQGPKDDR